MTNKIGLIINPTGKVECLSSGKIKFVGKKNRPKKIERKIGTINVFTKDEANEQAAALQWFLGKKVVLKKDHVFYTIPAKGKKTMDKHNIPKGSKLEFLSAAAHESPKVIWDVEIHFLILNSAVVPSYLCIRIGSRKKDWYEFYTKFQIQ